MDPMLVVPADWGANAYGAFYLLAFTVGGGILFYEGRRRGWPLVPWLVVMAWWTVGAVIGAKAFAIPLTVWRDALAAGVLPAAPGKTFLGMLVGGLVTVGLARRLVGFRGPVLDAFVPALPIALAVGRLGCLLSGCCHGTATSLPWSIAYEAAGLAPVHPTQLYEIAAMLGLVFAAWRWERLLRRSGSLFWSYAAAYSVYRFLAQFLRENASTSAGLSPLQWWLAGATLVCAGYVILRERGWMLSFDAVAPTAASRARTLSAGMPVLAVGLGAGSWFTQTEASLLAAVAQAGLVVLVWELARAHVRAGSRWATSATAIALVFLLVPNAGTQDSSWPRRDSSYVTVSLSGMRGQYPEGTPGLHHTGECGPQHLHRYKIGGGGVAYTLIRRNRRRFAVGLRGFGGTESWDDYKVSGSSGPVPGSGGSHTIWGVNPYVGFDSRWVGFSVGANFGDLFNEGHREALSGRTFDENSDRFAPRAQLSARLGPKDVVFWEMKINDHFPGSYPKPEMQFGIGIGLPHEGALRVGVSDVGWYLNPEIGVQGGLIFSPFASYMGHDQVKDGVVVAEKDRYLFGLSVRYSFGIDWTPYSEPGRRTTR